MNKIKLLVEIDEEQYNDIVKHLTDNDGNYAYSDFNLRETIRNGTPYNPTGDLISRSELMKAIGIMVEAEMPIDEKWALGLKHSLKVIDNAPAVENKQYELLDYIKLSLKDSDELKEKYRNKYKESNSQHDLYYSHLFEGMAEAYDDLLKKMGESDTQGKQDRPKGKWTFDEKGDFYCDQCGKYPHDQYATTNFCPKCGADMRTKESLNG